MYLNSWAFASLLANLENLSTVKKIFDGDAILTYFVYFLGYLPSLSNNVMGAKGVNVGGSWLSSACVRISSIKSAGIKGACIADICTGKTCIRDACTSNTYVKGTCTGVISDKSTCIGNTSAGSAWIKDTYTGVAGIGDAHVKDAGAKVSCAGGAQSVSTGGVSIVQDLEIYLQSSWILELRQYNITMETGIKVDWLLLIL